MNDSKRKAPPDDRPEAEALLIAYRATGDVGYRNRVVEQYKANVYKIAGNHKAKSFVDVEELISYGFDGLLRATEKWDVSRNVSFGHLAGKYIRFGIAEGLRSMCQSTRTQRERGEAKTFSRLSAVGSEGAREHREFADFEIADEFAAAVGRSTLSDWVERLIVVLTFREGWSCDWIAESLDLDEATVKRSVKAITARLGDGTVEVAPKVASLRHRAKVALAAAEREMRDVLADVAKFERAKMQDVVHQLLESLRLRRSRENYPWTAEVVERVDAVMKLYGRRALQTTLDGSVVVIWRKEPKAAGVTVRPRKPKVYPGQASFLDAVEPMCV